MKPYAAFLWNERRQLVLFNGGVGIITILVLYFLVAPYYQSSTVTILPDFGNKNSDMLSQFSGLASMAGVNVGGDVSTQIYQNLVTSESVVSDAIV